MFKPLDENKEFDILLDGKITVIKPIKLYTYTPLFCPNCEFPMKTSSDSASYKSYGCCEFCELHFALGANKDRWKDGWRPNKEEMKPLLEERELLLKQIINLK